ncbi:hypothetical protein RJ641_034480 [Dillenia turbinata]|uniref:Uncharacterized protein n=1 Tax=Dillenia turbinata TaxID=194707 RepID=A0AAN8VHT0_9MAGN
MAKNRKNKKKTVSAPMDISDHNLASPPQAMDTSEPGVSMPASGALSRKKKGVPMKRAKNVKKQKAIAKAISMQEKSVEKVLKNESKAMRTHSAKQLYD